MEEGRPSRALAGRGRYEPSSLQRARVYGLPYGSFPWTAPGRSRSTRWSVSIPTGRHIAQHLHANNGAIDFTSNQGLGVDMGQDMTADFHTYSIDWQPGSLKWLIDGKVTQQTTSNVPNVPMYLILNLAVGGNWPGDPTAATKFPAEMLVDWVRLWSST